jgi:hypothetical protein
MNGKSSKAVTAQAATVGILHQIKGILNFKERTS